MCDFSEEDAFSSHINMLDLIHVLLKKQLYFLLGCLMLLNA